MRTPFLPANDVTWSHLIISHVRSSRFVISLSYYIILSKYRIDNMIMIIVLRFAAIIRLYTFAPWHVFLFFFLYTSVVYNSYRQPTKKYRTTLGAVTLHENLRPSFHLSIAMRVTRVCSRIGPKKNCSSCINNNFPYKRRLVYLSI